MLFSANKTENSTVTYILDDHKVSDAHKLDFQNYLVIEVSKDNRSFDFKIARELDLEYFYREVRSFVYTTLLLICLTPIVQMLIKTLNFFCFMKVDMQVN